MTIEEKINEFKQLLNDHDVTFDYSDDPGVYTRGIKSLEAIREYAKQLPLPIAITCWNARMMDFFQPDYVSRWMIPIESTEFCPRS